MKKRRPDSPLDKHGDVLGRWLFDENLGYAVAVKKCWEELQVKTSVSALARWRASQEQGKLLASIADTAAKSTAVMEAFAANPGNSMDALMGLIGQAAFEAKLRGGSELDLSTLKDLAQLATLGLQARFDAENLRIKEADLQIKERRVVLLEKRAALADEAEKVTTSVLTPAEKEARMKEIFGIA